MARLSDLIRDSPVAKAMFGARYGAEDPYTLAIQNAAALGYPSPGAEADEGEAQRYMASKLAAERMGPVPLITNPLHEAALSWFAEGEGRPSLKRLMAGYRGALDAMEQPTAAPVAPREGFGLEGAEISAQPERGGSIRSLLAAVLAGGR